MNDDELQEIIRVARSRPDPVVLTMALDLVATREELRRLAGIVCPEDAESIDSVLEGSKKKDR